MTPNLFNSFEVNDYNRFAVVAVKETLNELHSFSSIIYIYGPTESGKSHLLNAAYEYCLSMPYVTIYTRACDLYRDLTAKRANRYEEADLLLIDDFNELSSLSGEEFSDMFDEILGWARMGKQIIMTANQQLTELKDLSKARKDAFESYSMNISIRR